MNDNRIQLKDLIEESTAYDKNETEYNNIKNEIEKGNFNFLYKEDEDEEEEEREPFEGYNDFDRIGDDVGETQ